MVDEDDLSVDPFPGEISILDEEDLAADPFPGEVHELRPRVVAVAAAEERQAVDGAPPSAIDEVRTILLRAIEGENKVRHRLAVAIVVTLCGAVGGALALLIVVVAVRPAEEGVVRDVALPIITGFGPIAGAVVGFYFAETRRAR